MNVSQAPKWLPEVLVPFFTLSYPSARPSSPDTFPDAKYYGTGRLDGCFVLTWVLVLSILRECLRQGLLKPFARQYLYRKDAASKGAINAALKAADGVANRHASVANGGKAPAPIPTQASTKNVVNQRPKGMSKTAWKRERSVLRFAEQGWQFAYAVTCWSLGMYIHMNLPSAPFQLDRLWLDYPHIPLAGPVKFYYLAQLGFWCHQVVLLNVEARRKDHFQMMSHHVITISLVIASYYSNFTRVGILIMVLMDWCDIFLPVFKMTRYLRLSQVMSDGIFYVYVVSWLITRHILFGIVIYSAYSVAPQLITFAWAPERGHYLTRDAHIIFVGSMVALQVILCGWTAMICRLVFKVLRGNPPDDVRSDDDSEADTEEADDNKKDQ